MMKLFPRFAVLPLAAVFALCFAAFLHAESKPATPRFSPPAESAPLSLARGPHSLYTKKYRENKRLLDLFDRLPELRAAALATLSDRLGLAYEDGDTIRLRLTDAGEKLARKRGILTAQRITAHEGGREALVINIYNEYIINGTTAHPEQEITHELTHAVMRELMGRESYVALPRWLREGLAVYTAGQGEERMSFVFANAVPRDPHALVNGLEGKHSFDDYPEDYLAILYIEKRLGAEALKKFVSLLVRDRVPYREALERSLGIGFADFLEAAARFANSRVDAWLAANPEFYSLCSGVRCFSESDLQSAEHLLRKALSGEPNPFIAAVARYYLARALQRTKRPGEALELFRKAGAEPFYTSFADNAAWYVLLDEYTKFVRDADARSAGEWRALERAFLDFIRDHPYSKELDRAWYYLAFLYRKGGAADRAVPAFLHVAENFPRSPNRAAAFYNASLCAFELGDEKAALEYAQKALKCVRSASLRSRIADLIGKIKESAPAN